MNRIHLPLILTGVLLLSAPSQGQFSRVEHTGNDVFTVHRSDSLFLEGQYDEARIALEQELSEGVGNSVNKLFNRGILARITHDGSGLGWFRQAYEMDKVNFRTAWKLGEALTDMARFEEAEAYLREAVNKDKGYYESSVALARNLRLQGKHDEATKALDRTFGRDRTYVPAFIEASLNYRAQGDSQSALDILIQGYRRFPYEQILIELIRLYKDLGNLSEVRNYASEYLHTYPFGPNTDEVLTLLREEFPDVGWERSSSYHHETYENGIPYGSPIKTLPLGQELTYKVKWGLITIGDLRVEILEGEYKGEPCFRARYIANSARGLPFVSISDTFYAYIDRELKHTNRLEMRYHEQGYHALKVYEADYENGYFHARILLGSGRWMVQEHPLPPAVFDATSQLWYAQQLIVAEKSGNCNVELSGGFEKTIINYLGRDEEIELSTGETVPKFKIDGIMHYSGIAGLTGDFQGWYIRDAKVWPVMAKFKIFLGWITIKYDHHGPGTIPPGPQFDVDLLR
jgi:tetratricopeptide (TPR) repeat protein